MKRLEKMSNKKLRELRSSALTILQTRRKAVHSQVEDRRIDVFVNILNGARLTDLAKKYDRSTPVIRCDFDKQLRRILWMNNGELKNKLCPNVSIWDLEKDWYFTNKEILLLAIGEWKRTKLTGG
jgi:hypothetical protein